MPSRSATSRAVGSSSRVPALMSRATRTAEARGRAVMNGAASMPTVTACSSSPSNTGSPVVLEKSATSTATGSGAGGSGRSAMSQVAATIAIAAAAADVQNGTDFSSDGSGSGRPARPDG